MTLADAKAAVVVARHEAAALQQWVHEARLAWAEQYAGLLRVAAEAKTTLEDAEATLRELALEAYATSGNTRPIPGVSIKAITRLVYDPEEAFTWAERHTCCLALDVKAFEQVAKAIVLPFVEVRKEPQAQLAKDLEEGSL